MIRPCFLVIDREYPGSISTRKLVIETAKFNVITAYSGSESLDTLRMFPAISGVVLDGDLRDIPCEVVAKSLKEIKPGIPIVVITGPHEDTCPSADHHLESFDPKQLLAILQNLQPVAHAEIEKHEEELNSKDI
jgi:DNA-binding NtrC family response regulator